MKIISNLHDYTLEITLDGLERFLLLRLLDDFIITCESEFYLDEAVQEFAREFRRGINGEKNENRTQEG